MKQLVLLLFLPLTGFTQLSKKESQHLYSVRFSSEWELQNMQQLYFQTNHSLTVTNHVKMAYRYNLTKKGKRKFETRYIYNENGKIAAKMYKSDTVNFTYKDTLLIEVARKDRKDIHLTTYQYDDQNRLTGKEYRKNNKLISQTTIGYYKKKMRSFTEEVNFDKKKHVYRIDNQYDTLLNRVERSLYTVDGKTKRVWNYECDERGKPEKSKVEAVSSSCVYNQSNNDGSFSVFSRNLQNGEYILYETLYAKDSVVYGFRRFEKDTILVYEQIKTDLNTVSKNFSDKGKLKSTVTKTEDDHGNLLEEVRLDKKMREKSRLKITYNNLSLPETIQYVPGKSKACFEYTYYTQ